MKNNEIDKLADLYKAFNDYSSNSKSLTEILSSSQQPAQRVSPDQLQKVQEAILRRAQQRQQSLSPQNQQKSQIFQRHSQLTPQVSQQMSTEAQRASDYLKDQLKLLDTPHSEDTKTISGTVTSEKFVDVEEIDFGSKSLKKIKNTQSLFDQEKLNPKSILYQAIASMTLEQNNVDESIALNENIKYSDKINYSYEKEFGRLLLTEDEQSDEIRESVDDPSFFEYYKFGYHDQEDKNHVLPMDIELFNTLTDRIYNDRRKNGFMLPSQIKESSNRYISEASDKEIRRTEPLVRKSGQMYVSTNDPDFEIQEFFSVLKKSKSR